MEIRILWSKEKHYFDITNYNGNIGAFVIYGYYK